MFYYFSISEKNGGNNIYLRKASKQYTNNDIALISIVELKTRNNSDFAKSFLSDTSLSCLKRLKKEFKDPILTFFSSKKEIFNNFKFTPKGGYNSYDLVKTEVIPENLTLLKEIPYITHGTRENVKSKKVEKLQNLMIKDKEIKRIEILNENLDKKIDYKNFDFIEELSTKSKKGQWRRIAFKYVDFKDKIFHCDIQSFKEGVFPQEFFILFKSKLRIFEEEVLPNINRNGSLDIDAIEFVDMKIEVAINKFGIKISKIKFKCKYTDKYYIYGRSALTKGMLSLTHKRDLSLSGSEASPLIKKLLFTAQCNGKNIENIVIKELKIKNKKFNSIVFEKNGKLYLENIKSFQENKNHEEEVLNKKGDIEKLRKEVKKIKDINKIKEIFISLGIDLTVEELSSLKLFENNVKFRLFNKEFKCNKNYLKEKLKIILNKAVRTTKTYIGIGLNNVDNINGVKIGKTNRYEGPVLERIYEIENLYTFKFNENKLIICLPGNHESRLKEFLLNKTVNQNKNLYAGVIHKQKKYTSLEFYHIDRLEDINEYLEINGFNDRLTF